MRSGDSSCVNPELRWDISGQAMRRGLALLFLLGLLIRVGFLLEHARTPSFAVPTLDQVYYDTVARMLLAGEDLHQLHGFRPLLYPMFLAICYRIGGAWGPDLAILLQHVSGAATGVLAALLGVRLFKHRLSGLIGGGLFLLAPVPLYFEGELLIEPTYIFLIMLALWVHLKAAESTGWKSVLFWVASGALIVLAAQARANIMVFLAIYPLFALWRAVEPGFASWRERTFSGKAPLAGFGDSPKRSRIVSAALPFAGLLGAVLMAVPWGLVNMSQSDHFHLLPNAGGVALYLGNKRTADGMTPEQERRIYSGDRYQDSIETWAREEYESASRAQGLTPDSDPMAISRYWTHRTVEEIKAAPLAWLGLMAKKTWLTFWNAEVPNNKAFAFLQQDYFWLRILPIRWVLLAAFAPAGLWLAWRAGNRDALLILFAYAALYSAANIVFFICDRYRYPVWPVAAIFAGGGLTWLIELVRCRRFGSALTVAAAAACMVLVSIPNWFGAKLPDFSRDYFFRSIAWYEKGHYQEALEDINKSVEMYPLEASALHHRGNVLFALKRLPEAEKAYRQALTLSPEEAGIWNNLAATLAGLGRTNEALASYTRAMDCRPTSKNAFLGAACIQIQLGRYSQAAKILDDLNSTIPGQDPTALALRSVLVRRTGDIAQADILEQNARHLNPGTAAWAIQRASEKR